MDPKGGGSCLEVPTKPGLLCAIGSILAYLLCKHFTGKRRRSVGSLGTCSGWRKKHSESSKEKNRVPKARCNLVRPAWGLEPFCSSTGQSQRLRNFSQNRQPAVCLTDLTDLGKVPSAASCLSAITRGLRLLPFLHLKQKVC